MNWPDKVPCPKCGKTDKIGCNPNRWSKTGGAACWYRCWNCGALWDNEGTDWVARWPVLGMSSEYAQQEWAKSHAR